MSMKAEKAAGRAGRYSLEKDDGKRLLPFKEKFFIFCSFLFFPFSLGAQVEINWGEESFYSEAEVRVRQGRTYVNVEELFREIGDCLLFSHYE